MTNFDRARAAMVNSQLRTADVVDVAVLDAFAAVPRECFVPAGREGFAYTDADTPLPSAGAPRAMMDAMPLARLIQALQPLSGRRALVVGAGSGYGAALLKTLGADVTALEDDPVLAAFAERALAAAGIEGVALVAGPMTAGWPAAAPYDAVLVDGAVDALSDALEEQVADGGSLAAVIGRGRGARALLFRKSGRHLAGRTLFDAAVPSLPAFARAEGFEFAL